MGEQMMFADMDLQLSEVSTSSFKCKEQRPPINPFIEANKGVIDDYDGQQLNLEFYDTGMYHHWMEDLIQGKKYTMLTFDSNLDPVYIHFKFISLFQSDSQFILTYRQKWKRRDNVKIVCTSSPIVLWESYVSVGETINTTPFLNNLITHDLYLDEEKSKLTATA